MIKNVKQIVFLLILVLLTVSCAAPPTPTEQADQSFATAEQTTLPAATESATEPAPTTAITPTLETENEPSQNNTDLLETNTMVVQIGGTTLYATLVENSSTTALKEALAQGPLTINMRDYGSMEKVGSFGITLPTNDEQITTEAGDLILYQGNAFVIYYAPNAWNFTRLGKINDVTADELLQILGSGDVTVTLSLSQE